MIAVDASLLVYAHRRESPEHAAVRAVAPAAKCSISRFCRFSGPLMSRLMNLVSEVVLTGWSLSCAKDALCNIVRGRVVWEQEVKQIAQEKSNG